MADPLSSVGVVMVTHNSSSDAPRALSALPLKRLAGVVVVDNASTDGTAEQLKQLWLPGVTVLDAPNDGFGAGCNLGVASLPPVNYALLLNPDASIRSEDLESLVCYLRAHPVSAAVAPRLYRGHRPLTSAGRLATVRSELRFALPPLIAHRIADRRLPPEWDRSGPVGAVEGACVLVEAAAFRDVGGFDPGYFLFFEEHELGRRLAQHGRQVHLCAEARAQHEVGTSRAGIALAGVDHYWYSAMRYLNRWCSRPGALLVATALRATMLLSVARRSMSWRDARRLSRALHEGRRGR